MADEEARDDNIQHGIDDNTHGDAEKGGVIGAVGGAIVGGLAGGPVWPLGAVIGAVAGGIASGIGVAAVDRVDNDNNVTGIGHGIATDTDNQMNDDSTVDDHLSGNSVEVVDTEEQYRTGMGGYNAYEDDFRNDFQTNYAGSGNYDEYQPAYYYGCDLASNPRYQNSDWNTVEPSARRDWESGHEGAWDKFKDSVRYAWNRTRQAL